MSTAPRSKTSRPRSMAYHIRFAIICSVIGAFYSVTPISYLYAAWWLCTSHLPSLRPYGPSTSGLSSHLLRSIFYYACAEIAFSFVYQTLAIWVDRRRPPTNYTPRELRDVCKLSLESNLDNFHYSEKATASAITSAALEEPGVMRRRRQMSSGSEGSRSDSSERSDSDMEFKWDDSPSPSSSSSSSFGDDDVTLSPDASPSYKFLHPKKLSYDDPRAKDFRETLSGWFHGAPFEDIRRDDARQWMAWSLFGQPYEELVAEREAAGGMIPEHIQREEDLGRDKLESVDYTLELWEARAGAVIPPGKGEGVVVARLTLDKVRVMSRPLLLYGLVWIAQTVYRVMLYRMGFKLVECGGLNYYVRIPKGWKPSRSLAEDTRPLVFFHGLGVGLVQYSPIINTLAKKKSFARRPLVFLVQPHLSMSFFSSRFLQPPNATECGRSFRALVSKFKFEGPGVTLASHSNGTTVHAWMLKAAPEFVKRSMIVDPVCFSLWESSLPYNFLYAAAKTPMQFLMRYFVSRELGIANMLHRHYDWISSIVWPHELHREGHQAKVFFSEKDSIVDTKRNSKYLEREGVDIKIFKGLKHGESVMGGEAFREVLDWLADKRD